MIQLALIKVKAIQIFISELNLLISLRIGHLKNQMKYEWSRRSRTNYAMIKQEREQRREKTVGGWANTSLRNTFLFEILFLSDSRKFHR